MEHSDGIKISAKTRSSCLFCQVDAVLIPETCYSTPTQACRPPTSRTVGTSIPIPTFIKHIRLFTRRPAADGLRDRMSTGFAVIPQPDPACLPARGFLASLR